MYGKSFYTKTLLKKFEAQEKGRKRTLNKHTAFILLLPHETLKDQKHIVIKWYLISPLFIFLKPALGVHYVVWLFDE